MNLTTENGQRFIAADEISSYSATAYGQFNCVIYLKTGESIWIYETFEQVDAVFDL